MSAIGVRRVGVRVFVLSSALFTVTLVLLAMSARPAVAAMMTELLSVSSAGVEGNGPAGDAQITPDGRYAAFMSRASNLVVGDDNGLDDVFVRDLRTGSTTRVSITSGGVQATGGHSSRPSISADGRYVAFESWATNLFPGDAGGYHDILVRDRQTNTTTLVSKSSSGDKGNGDSVFASISADGRYVAFMSDATNFVTGDTNSQSDVFVHDRQTGVTTRVSVATFNVQALGGDSGYPSISADGRFVAFSSDASNLHWGVVDDNGARDVFIHDRVGLLGIPLTYRVSVTDSGGQANGSSLSAGISADGSRVAFSSTATNLVAGDTNNQPDIFVRDLTNQRTRRVSISSSGTQGNSNSTAGSISATGRYVTFMSFASNLVAGDTNERIDIFVHDILRRSTRRVSVSSSGVQGNGDSLQSSVSGDGKRTTFFSYANNLVGPLEHGVTHAYVHTAPSVVTRIADRTRFSTAVAIAHDGHPEWGGAGHVIVASGDDRAAADPLAASGLCWAYDAPMLLVSAARTPDEAKAAVEAIVAKNGTATLHVVGGPISVPEARLAELVTAGGGNTKVTVDRVLATGSRYDMAAAIARRMRSVAASSATKTMPKTALFANGADSAKFFDALALSPISAATGAPILLVSATSVPVATANAVDELAPTTRIVGGGPNTVSESVRSRLGATRWAGRTRYDTAIAIADGAVSRTWLTRSYVGLAAKLPDALTGGSLMGSNTGVLLLTDGTTLTPVTKSWLTARKWDVAEVYVFGGVLSISESVVGQVRSALQ